MTVLDQHLIDIGACQQACAAAAERCQTAAQAWELLLTEKRVDWAVWWLAIDGGWPAAEPLLRRWVLRILRERAPAFVDVATVERLRTIADTATWDELQEGLRAFANANALASDLASDLDLDLALALDHAHAIARALARDIAHALALANALARALASALASASVLALALARDVDQQVADLRELCKCPWTEPGVNL